MCASQRLETTSPADSDLKIANYFNKLNRIHEVDGVVVATLYRALRTWVDANPVRQGSVSGMAEAL